MKKLLLTISLLVLISALVLSVYAANSKVIDHADLLTSYEESYLESRANALTDTYGMDVIILTVDSTNGKTVTAYADDYFDYNGYGIGYDHSGVLLLLSMEDRDYAISTCGKGIDALTDYGLEQLMDQVLPYLRNDEYYQGFQVYLNELDSYFEAYAQGSPIGATDDEADAWVLVLTCLGVGAVVGLITILIMRSGMKTAVFQHGAQDYIVSGTYQLRHQRDIFLYSHVTKVRRSSDSSSGSHRSSSGRSHGGRSGKF